MRIMPVPTLSEQLRELALANRIAAQPPHALRLTKSLLRQGQSALVIAMSGGHRESSRRLVGGHVALLAVDSTLRRPGVFVCI